MLLVNPLENKEYFNKSIKTHIALAVHIYLLKDTAGFCLSWWNYWAYLFCLFSYTAFICCIIVITQLESEGGIHGKVSSNYGRHPSSKIICTNWYLSPDDDLMNIFIFPHSALIIILKKHHHYHHHHSHHHHHHHPHHQNSKCTDYNPQIWLNQLTPKRLSVWSTHTWVHFSSDSEHVPAIIIWCPH